MTSGKTEATFLTAEASRLERLTRTGMATQQDLGHFLRVGLIGRDDYLRLDDATLRYCADMSDESDSAVHEAVGGPGRDHVASE